MNQTKETILTKANEVFNHLEYSDLIKGIKRCVYTEDESDLKGVSSHAWKVFAEIPDDQFEGQMGVLVLLIDDDTLEPYYFHDISGGRTVPCKISKDTNGKYYLSGTWWNN